MDHPPHVDVNHLVPPVRLSERAAPDARPCVVVEEMNCFVLAEHDIVKVFDAGGISNIRYNRSDRTSVGELRGDLCLPCLELLFVYIRHHDMHTLSCALHSYALPDPLLSQTITRSVYHCTCTYRAAARNYSDISRRKYAGEGRHL